MDGIAAVTAGAMIGLSIAVPVGPMGLLCINRTLNQGLLTGISTGAGASTIHVVYCAVVLVGLQQVGPWLEGHRQVLNLVGAVLMLFFAVRLLRARRRVAAARPAGRPSLLLAYVTALAFNLSNPMTLALLTGSVASIVGATALPAASIDLMLVGTFAGSVAWWVCLACSTAILRRRLNAGVLRVVNDFAAAAMIVFGSLAMSRVLAFD